ncbi:RNA polymerase factor sigma-54 [Methylotenera versatilis]|uniref:RNA polymerase sigma-54 factor n=1 Tax=Methylotenera versatilis (strain 301) TaxID=666681 RepID=D7DL06_METV0|nr:RNA polymerase factor sigma-54 [Methylotenera versatilis]ADI28617.1 RNA polymerase, sigma 54 subunit, RpoN [Methylotenera versatilis 301]
MKQGLQLRFSQNLSLTPQLQQAIKLLQLSTLELNQEIDLLMQTNPLLERGDDGEDEYGNATDNSEDEVTVNTTSNDGNVTDTTQEYEASSDVDFEKTSTEFTEGKAELSQTEPTEFDASTSEFEQSTTDFSAEFNDDYDEYSNGSLWDENSTPADDDSDYKQQETLQISLREHLLSQLKLMQLSARDQTLTMLLVDSINEDGYLEASLEEIVEEMPEELEIEVLELQTALRHIQNLDPAGVGARNLSECLLLQLDLLPKFTPHLELAKLMAKHYLVALGARDFGKLRKELGCDEATLKCVQQVITNLNPRPGSAFSIIGSEHYIQHEVIIKKVKGIWIASLNDAVIPKLKINQLYAGILKRNRDSSSQYLQSQMQEAKWMIKNIHQRFSTILRVSQAITDRQRNFLEYGEVAMKPLVLREIAEELELHESTISRVTNNKYMLTPRGIFELKYFFGSSVATDTGGTCSATAIRALIKQLVDQENPKKPYSDSQITDLLAKQGIVVARRTIAKYRESLNIAPASLRKSL